MSFSNGVSPGMFLRVICVIMLAAASANAQPILIENHSFEEVNTIPVGGVWPEADADPVTNDHWLEPGPADGDLNAFPPELIPPGFTPPAGATLDTGVFFNTPVVSDGQGGFVQNPGFVTNAHGSQLAYLFASNSVVPPIGFLQWTDQSIASGGEYKLTVAVGKSFFLPASGGSTGDPTMAIQLIYDDGGSTELLSETIIAASEVQSTSLTDFHVTALIGDASPAIDDLLGVRILPVDGTAGSWIFDNVRLSQVPEPASLALMAIAGVAMMNRRQSA